jgi:hypothetical protein
VVVEGNKVALAQRSEELPVSAAEAVTVQRIAADAPSGSADPKPVRSGWAKPGARARGRRTVEDSASATVAAADADADDLPAI